MLKKKAAVPDAWEDDWETQADRAPNDTTEPEPRAPLTKAERLAQHAETNRKIWESADSQQTFHYLEANNTVPLANNFKPQVKVLSRKPVIAKRDPVTGMPIDDGEEEPKKEVQLTPEEIRAKQKKDREEKQRRYEEARAKIFGESAPSSGASSPGTVTPPRSDGHHTPRGRGRGRGRGGYRGGGNDIRPVEQQYDNRQFDSPRRTQNLSASGRELYDPNQAPRPESRPESKQEGRPNVRRFVDTPGQGVSLREEQYVPIRAPRGPDGSGRGGFGFAPRGGKES